MSKFTFFLILFFITMYRCWISTQVGLGADEAHYFLYGKYLDWSYFDHPPMVGWIQYFFRFLPILPDLAARLPAILCSLVTSWLLHRFLIQRGYSIQAVRMSVIAVNSTLLFNVLSIMWLPDTPLLPLTLLVIQATENVETHNDFISWIKLGVWLGLSGLTKYTSIFFVLALVLYFLQEQRWRKLLTGRWIAGLFVAIGLQWPVLHWNLSNDFISFKYQSNHIFGFDHFSLIYFLQTQMAQMVGWGGGFYFLGLKALFLSRNAIRHHRLKLVLLIAAILFAIFTVVSFSQPLLPHWLLIPFTLMIAIATAHWVDLERSRTIQWSLGISSIISLILFLELGFHFFPKIWRPGIYKQIIHWDEIVRQANKNLKNLPAKNKGLAVMNWSLGSRAYHYNNENSLVFVLDDKITQFDLWNSLSPVGYDLIIFIEDDKIDEYYNHIQCDSLKKIDHYKTQVENVVVNQITYYQCLGFKTLQ